MLRLHNHRHVQVIFRSHVFCRRRSRVGVQLNLCHPLIKLPLMDCRFCSSKACTPSPSKSLAFATARSVSCPRLRGTFLRSSNCNAFPYDFFPSIVVPFEYYPRTRSHRPIISSPCFFSAVKASPEEWYQGLGSMRVRAGSSMEPIQCHVSDSRLFDVNTAESPSPALHTRWANLRVE